MRRNQLNPRSLREGGGPDAQHQSSTQPKNRKAIASGRATVRMVHYFHSTAQPQVSQSETHHQPEETPESETRFEPEVRRSLKESVTPESATRDQPRSQSLLPNEPEAHRSSNPPDSGQCGTTKVKGLPAAASSKRLAAPKVVFQPTGLRDLRKS